MEFELRLAGVRNVKAAKALLDEHDGDVSSLKSAEPWLFSDGKATGLQSGATGLPNAGAATDEKRLTKHWREVAGLESDALSDESVTRSAAWLYDASDGSWVGRYGIAQGHASDVPGAQDTTYSVSSVGFDDVSEDCHGNALLGEMRPYAPHDGQLLHYDDGYYIVRYDSQIAGCLRERPERLVLDGVDYEYAGCRWYSDDDADSSALSYRQLLEYARQDDGIGIQTNTADGKTVVVLHYVPSDGSVTALSNGSGAGADVQNVPTGSWVDEHGVVVPQPNDVSHASLSSVNGTSDSTVPTPSDASPDGDLTGFGGGWHVARNGATAAQCVISRAAYVSVDGAEYAYDGCRVVRAGDDGALSAAHDYATSGDGIGIAVTYGEWDVVMRYVPTHGLQG